MKRALLLLLVVGCATGSTVKGPLKPFASSGITRHPAPRRIALLVGVDNFEDARFHPLRWASADARALAQAIDGLDRVIVLSRPEETSRAAVLSAFHSLEREVQSPEDTVIVYFSTHGTLARRPGGELERYLVMRDTRLDVVSETGLSLSALTGELDRLISRKKALILATCHSGRGKSLLSDPLQIALAEHKGPPPLEAVSEALIVMTAAAQVEAAIESDRLEHDVYTYYLLEGLERGDRDGDGAVSATEAHDYAREGTYQFTSGQQRPTLESVVIGRDPIWLHGRPVRRPRPIVHSYAPSSDGLELWVDGRSKGQFPGTMAIEPGPHRVELRAHSELVWGGEVSLAAGEAVDLAELIPPSLGLELDAAGDLELPLTQGAFAEWPILGRVGLRGTLLHWPLKGLGLGVELGYGGGAGSVLGGRSALPYRLDVFSAAVRAAYRWSWSGDWSSAFAIHGGTLEAWRKVNRPEFIGTDYLRGVDAGAEISLRWSPGGGLRIGAELGLGALIARFGEVVGAYPSLRFGGVVSFAPKGGGL